MPKIEFHDDSRDKNQGNIIVDVPMFFYQSLNALLKSFKQTRSPSQVFLGNMAGFLHIRIKYHYKESKHYMIGWDKPKTKNVTNEDYLQKLGKKIYINRVALKELGLISEDDHSLLKDLLYNAGYRMEKFREERENSFLDIDNGNELNIQSSIMTLISSWIQ